MAGNAVSTRVKIISGILVACVAIAMSYYRHHQTHQTPPITTFDALTFGQSYEEVKAQIECYLPQPASEDSVFASAIKTTDCGHYMFNGDIHLAYFEFINNKLSRVSIDIFGDEWEEIMPLLTKKYGAADHQITKGKMYEIEHGPSGIDDFVSFGDTGQVGIRTFLFYGKLQQAVIFQSPTRQKDYDNASNYSS